MSIILANQYLYFFVLISGLLIAIKIRKFKMYITFLVFAVATILYVNLSYYDSISAILWDIIASWPIFFLAGFMLTEPRTYPTDNKMQIVYACIVGVLFGSSFSVGPFHSTPEFALIVGNLFSYLVSDKQSIKLSLLKKHKVGSDLYNFVFSSPTEVTFVPGQYAEWTLPHKKTDKRGNRRYFSLASAPNQKLVDLGLKIPENASSFKGALLNMKVGGHIYLSHFSGDFTLSNQDNEIAFIAGGIGITPIRSILLHLNTIGEKRDIILYYACRSENEFAYSEELSSIAKSIGLKIMLICTEGDGYLTPEMVKSDKKYKTRLYYLSGPNNMVDAYEDLLTSIGIKRDRIIKDYIPGY